MALNSEPVAESKLVRSVKTLIGPTVNVGAALGGAACTGIEAALPNANALAKSAATIAPASQGISVRWSGTSGAPACATRNECPIRRRTATPSPAPQYSSPASTIGSIIPRSALAAGVEMPKSAAESRARTTA